MSEQLSSILYRPYSSPCQQYLLHCAGEMAVTDSCTSKANSVCVCTCVFHLSLRMILLDLVMEFRQRNLLQLLCFMPKRAGRGSAKGTRR